MQARSIGVCQMIVCAVLWSIAGVFIGLLDMNGFVIAGGRSLFAALTVLVYMALTGQKIIVSRDTIVSGILLCGVFICFVVANKYTTAANARMLVSSSIRADRRSSTSTIPTRRRSPSPPPAGGRGRSGSSARASPARTTGSVRRPPAVLPAWPAAR